MQAKTRDPEVFRCADLDEAVRHFEALRASGERATLERSSDGWIVQRVTADE